MKTKLLLSAFLVLAFAGSLQAATELARINSRVITVEEFNKRYRDNLKYSQYHPAKKSVLDELVKRELGIQEAKRLGLDKDPEVQDRVNTVLYSALLEKKLSKELESIQVSDEDAREFYSKYPDIRTSHIFIAVSPTAKPEEVKKAQERIKGIQEKYLRDGKMSFAEVAQRFSEGVAAPMGGDIDYQSKQKLDPQYYAAALALGSPGKVSGIVRSSIGFHIIKLTAIKPWEDADKAEVKRMVFDARRNAAYERYMTELKSHAKVTVHNELLKD